MRYYRDAVHVDKAGEDIEAARAALLSLFSANIRALQLLPQSEQRRFLRMCERLPQERAIVLLDPDQPPTAPPPWRAAAVLAIGAIVIGIAAVSVRELLSVHAGEHAAFAPVPRHARIVSAAHPAPHQVITTHRLIAVHRAPTLRTPALRAPVFRAPRIKAQNYRVARLQRVGTPVKAIAHRHAVLPGPPKRRIALARLPTITISVPRPKASHPAPEAEIASLYSQANPDANVRSVVIVEDSPQRLVANVTSREDTSTITDQLTLAPRGRSFRLLATQRLTNGSQNARLCYSGGAWKSC
jgi:hypothetical protein